MNNGKEFDLEDELNDLISKAMNEHDMSFVDIIHIFNDIVAELEEEASEVEYDEE